MRSENISFYREIYENILHRRNTDRKSFEFLVNNRWRWFRIYLINVNNDNMVGILEDFTEEREQELEIKSISEKSKYDFLTGIYNRETFEKEFDKFLKEGYRKNKVSALFLMDLDNFKKVNDLFGHDIGDKVLCDTAETLKTHVRNTDFLGRLGGDEFTLLIKNAENLEAICKIAQKLNFFLVKNYTKDDKDSEITVSASIGIAIIKENSTFKAVYKEADNALYKAKFNGKNSYFIFN